MEESSDEDEPLTPTEKAKANFKQSAENEEKKLDVPFASVPASLDNLSLPEEMEGNTPPVVYATKAPPVAKPVYDAAKAGSSSA